MSTAAMASSQARQAQQTACEALMASFDAKSATVAQAKHYAQCVEIVHPEPVDVDSISLRIMATLLIAACIAGAVWGYKEEGVGMAILQAIVAPLLGLFVLGAGVLLVMGIKFVLTGAV